MTSARAPTDTSRGAPLLDEPAARGAASGPGPAGGTIFLALASPATPHWAVAFALTAVGYVLIARLSLLLAIPPGYAAPLYPAAGLALAAVLVYGWRIVPAVALGSFAINVWLGLQQREPSLAVFAVAALIGGGAALQALVGAALVRRFVRQPLTLAEPVDIALFFGLGAFVACAVSASVATLALAAFRVVPHEALPLNWLTWWFGDSLGTVIGAPIVLTLIGAPRHDWATRRLTVGLTLGLATTLLAAGIHQVVRWDDMRARDGFDREADGAVTAVRFKLQQTLHALQALRDVYAESGTIDRKELRLATSAWLGGAGQLQALGFAQRVTREALPQFEEQARAEGYADYRVMDRLSGHTRPDRRVPVSGNEAFAIRQIEPLKGNAAALGVNLLSLPQSKAAIARSIASGQPAATGAFLLSQDPPTSTLPGVAIYQAVPAVKPGDPARGVVFAGLHGEQVLQLLLRELPRSMRVCLFDAAPPAALGLLAGPPGCTAAPPGYTHVRSLDFAGRQWQVRVDALPGRVPVAGGTGDAWLFAVVGLLSTAVLGALLLTVTGRTRRIEVAVRERTAALEQEVRDREQAESAMRGSDQRFRNIFNNVPLGVVYTDLAGNVKQTNPHFCALVGHAAEALLAMNARDYIHPDDWDTDREAKAGLLAGGAAVERRQKRYVTATGRVLCVQSTISLLRDEYGRPQRFVSTAEDITENLRLADADRARRAAEAANRAKSDFLSRMSHELRTPLNAMLGFAQLLELDRRQPLSDAQRPWVAQIQQAGWHLLEMINDVLDLSRIESGNLRLTVETLALDELMAATVPLLQREARARSIVIGQDLSADALKVLGDATRVRQILTNLLSNAIKYNVDGGRVDLQSRRSGDFVEITVTDTGLGMTPAQMDELFQPFNRLGRERSELEGTGIGLVISQRLAELMGGSLRARSTTGEGSAFTLALPFAEEADTVPAEFDVPAAVAADIGYHRRRVHYVEDNETNVEVMRGIMAQRPQVQLEVSTTGLDGLAAIRAGRPDVILLDMHLPDISGMELLRHLQQDAETAAIPVVAVSADALQSQIVQAESLGAYRYLTKPVNVGELLGVLDELLGDAETRFG